MSAVRARKRLSVGRDDVRRRRDQRPRRVSAIRAPERLSVGRVDVRRRCGVWPPGVPGAHEHRKNHRRPWKLKTHDAAVAAVTYGLGAFSLPCN